MRIYITYACKCKACCVFLTGSERIFLKDERPVSCWEENDMLFCVAPNLVCTHIFQTGGGGDNISAAGLSLQIVD